MKYYSIIFFVFLISLKSFAQHPLPLNSDAPKFLALEHNGKFITLSEKLKKGKVVILFYRGQWCPHCTRHMSNLNDSIKFISDLGASVIAITPENNENIDKTILKSKVCIEENFNIIYDEGHKIMDAYQVTFRQTKLKKFFHLLIGTNINLASGNEDDVLPVPATYIINQEGKIIGFHFEKDFTQRMSVKEIVKVLENN